MGPCAQTRTLPYQPDPVLESVMEILQESNDVSMDKDTIHNNKP